MSDKWRTHTLYVTVPVKVRLHGDVTIEDVVYDLKGCPPYRDTIICGMWGRTLQRQGVVSVKTAKRAVAVKEKR